MDSHQKTKCIFMIKEDRDKHRRKIQVQNSFYHFRKVEIKVIAPLLYFHSSVFTPDVTHVEHCLDIITTLTCSAFSIATPSQVLLPQPCRLYTVVLKPLKLAVKVKFKSWVTERRQ